MRYIDKDAALEAINDAPQFSNEKITKFDVAMFLNSRPTAALEVGDTISRHGVLDAIDTIEEEVADGYGFQYGKWRKYIADMPFAQPQAKCIAKITLNEEQLRDAVEKAKHEVVTVLPQRKRGRWIGYNADNSVWLRDDGEPIFLVCSECHRTVLNNGSANWNYCPSCGARMEVGTDATN